jgi:maltose/maltodextrin transport system permease protein
MSARLLHTRGQPVPLSRGSVLAGRIGRWGLLAVMTGLGLWAVMAVHAAGQSLLATVLLLLTALAVWTYASSRSGALRYLFPAVAAAFLFVAFPMVYTVGMGFTNQSSRNLVDRDQARAQLLDERLVDVQTQRPFELWLLDGQAYLEVAPLGSASQAEVWRSALVSSAAGPTTLQSPAKALTVVPLQVQPLAERPAQAKAATLAERVAWLDTLQPLSLKPPDGSTALRLVSLREVAAAEPLYEALPDGALLDRRSGVRYMPDERRGFFAAADGTTLQPGFRVFVGLEHYARLFTEPNFREPFLGVFIWTVAFSGLTVLGAGALGLLLACLLNWPALQGRSVYRVVLFLPYAVPAFLSILVFKGLFNQNLGEVNLILGGLFGIQPAWFSDPTLARVMLLIVNIWLGFPYMMVLCSGLIQSISPDLYEASAIAGASPWDNFRRITLPLILKPLTPLLISAFAFNFNNFVLISLLTGGRPDHLDSDVPAGTTDILVSYTWRIAFQDSGNQYGLAAAVSTVIFALVALITVVQMRVAKMGDEGKR